MHSTAFCCLQDIYILDVSLNITNATNRSAFWSYITLCAFNNSLILLYTSFKLHPLFFTGKSANFNCNRYISDFSSDKRKIREKKAHSQALSQMKIGKVYLSKYHVNFWVEIQWSGRYSNGWLRWMVFENGAAWRMHAEKRRYRWKGSLRKYNVFSLHGVQSVHRNCKRYEITESEQV